MSANIEDDIICSDTIKRRKIKPQNIVCRIIARERGPNRPGTNVHIAREFYQNIYPNLTVINVEKPAGFLRKFSPDGKYLIAFTFDQTSLEIYRFRGVVAAAHLINNFDGEVVPNSNTDVPYTIRSQIFDKLFKLKFVVNVATSSGKQLNRECSLFTNDNQYVIVGAASFITDDMRPNFYELYTSNEAITPTLRYFFFFLIELNLNFS